MIMQYLKLCVFCFRVNTYLFSFLVVLWISLLFLLARSAIPLEIMSKVGLREDALISTVSTVNSLSIYSFLTSLYKIARRFRQQLGQNSVTLFSYPCLYCVCNSVNH